MVLGFRYALTILWHDRTVYLSAVLGVTFSTVLIALQSGLLIGQVIYSSFTIDHALAELWVGAPDVNSPLLAQPIPEAWLLRVAAQPEVCQAELLYVSQGLWHKPGQGSRESCIIVGSRLAPDSLGALTQMSPALRARLAEPMTVAVIEEELSTYGLRPGQEWSAELNGQRVRVVGTVRGFHGALYPHVFCSVQTVRRLDPGFNLPVASFVLARCRRPGEAEVVAARLQEAHPEMQCSTAAGFSKRTRNYWLFRTKAGTVLLCTVALALLVGTVITSQTLRGAVSRALPEYAVLDAMGIDRRRIVGLILIQSWWIGTMGVLLALPITLALAGAMIWTGTNVALPGWLLVCCPAVNLALALVSGVSALRALQRLETILLLR